MQLKCQVFNIKEGRMQESGLNLTTKESIINNRININKVSCNIFLIVKKNFLLFILNIFIPFENICLFHSLGYYLLYLILTTIKKRFIDSGFCKRKKHFINKIE